MSTKFGTFEKPDWEAIYTIATNQLNDAMKTISLIRSPLELNLENPTPFVETPEKGYTAKAKITLNINGVQKDIPIIAFRPGDGTGDESLVSVQTTKIPDQYFHAEKTWRVLPRSKMSLRGEIMFPLGTYQENTAVNLQNLEILTLANEEVTFARELGFTQHGYEQRLKDKDAVAKYSIYPENHTMFTGHKLYMTTGYDWLGQKVLDPHAIYSSIDNPKSIQVAAFLSILQNNEAPEFLNFVRQLTSR